VRLKAHILSPFLLLLGSCGGGETKSYTPHIEDWERQLGAEQHPQILGEFGGSYEGDEAGYVAAVGERVAAAAGLPRQCTFTLVNTDVVNAFAVPGCYIYVTRGLLGIVNSEAELASILAHEAGHIVADHSERQQKRSLWRSLGVYAVGLVTGSENLTRIAGRAAALFTLRYSRKQEYEADDLGIATMAKAGYDPYAAGDMFGALARNERFVAQTSGRDEASSIPEWSRTHPLTENRIGRARETAAATGFAEDALPEKKAPFLDTVDGLLYGDDPEQGFVVGRHFAHPMLRIAFTAPPGFTLTNSPAAILIEGPDGLRGEFGGGRLPADGLETYVSALIARLLQGAAAEIGPPARTLINGVPAIIVAVRAATEAGAIELSIAAYDGGDGRAHHFIMISPPTAAADVAITELFRSFRLLSPQQAAALRPRIIEVVAAGPRDTPASLAARMATDHKLAHFLMLNGRTTDAPLRAGERVKIVVGR
jgi:predicted Zn-dependent protease